MRTFHVISINFQFRFAVDGCIVTQQDICVRLECIDLLCIFAYKYFSVEYCCCFSVDYTFVQFIGFAICNFVIYDRMIVNMLISVQNICSVQMRFTILSVYLNSQIITYQCTV
ncbi:hypothetical protein D3C85_1610710 [compost metagenome]